MLVANKEIFEKLTPLLSELEKKEMLDYHFVYQKYNSEIADVALKELSLHPVFGKIIREMPEGFWEERNKISKQVVYTAIVENNWMPYIEFQLHQGKTYAKMGLHFRTWYEVMGLAKKYLIPFLTKEYISGPALASALNGMNRMIDIGLALIGDAYFLEKQENAENHKRELEKNLQEISAYKYALEESSIVAITNQKGIISYVNENFCKISKYSFAELIGQDHRIINSGYHSKEFIKSLWTTIAAGNVWKGDLKNKAKDGTIYWVDTTIVPFLDSNGKPYQYVSIRSDITDKKNAENEISAYKYALDESSIIAITNQKGIITYVNENFCKISKYSSAELIGQDHRIINSGYHSKVFIKNIWETIANGRVWKGDIKNKAKDGTIYWVDTTIVPFLDTKGKPYQYVAIRSDITDKKNAENEIKNLYDELEEKVKKRTEELQLTLDEISNFKSLFETTPGLYLVLLPDLTITAVTDEYLNATMLKRKDVVGRKLFDVFPDNPEDSSADGVKNLRSSLEKVLATKLPSAMPIQKYDIRRPDGVFEERFWSPLNKPVLNSNNEVVYITHSVVDITERLKREQEIIRVSDENKDLYNKAPCGYLSVDSSIFFTNMNETMLNWLGYSADEVIGKLKFEDILSPESREIHLNTFDEVFAQYLKTGSVTDLDYTIQRKDKTTFPAVINSAAVFNEKGEFVQSRTVVLDNTFRKGAEEKWHAVNKELEAFSYSVSHDLRAPLRAINGFAKILKEDYEAKLDEDGIAILNSIMNNSKKMGTLIDDLLTFSRLGRLEMTTNEINMRALVRVVVDEEMQGNLTEVDLKIGELISASGNQILIKQVWVNLISNALKYSRFQPKQKIEIGSYREGNFVVYFVKDNGVGFDMTYYDKLFGVFQRLHSQEEFEGTGVGLAIVQKIVARHNGTVWAESKLKKGATFSFSLPLINQLT